MRSQGILPTVLGYDGQCHRTDPHCNIANNDSVLNMIDSVACVVVGVTLIIL